MHAQVIETIALPDSIDGIDKEWLNSALEAWDQPFRITACERLDVAHMNATRARYCLEYDRDLGLPTRLILKGGFEDHSERMAAILQWEAKFYSQIAPTVSLELPAVYWAGIDPGGWRAAVLMEDLTARDVTFRRAQAPLNFDEVRRRLEMLATLHAQTWNSAKLLPGGEWDWVPYRFSEWQWAYTDYYLSPERWRFYVESPRGAAVSTQFHDAIWLRNAMRRLDELVDEDDFCLTHGDTHLGNLYVATDGTPGFFDPTVVRSAWWTEVSYHIGCSLDLADRRRWEAALVAHYVDALERAGGPRLAFDHAWLRYRQGLLFGYFVFIINETQFQTEATNTAYATRFAAAMVDHDTKALVGVVSV